MNALFEVKVRVHLPVGVVSSGKEWFCQLPAVPELHRAVVTTGGEVVRFVGVKVQSSYTRPVDLLQTEGHPINQPPSP